MVRIDQTFSAEHATPIRLYSFLAFADLFLRHELDFRPFVREVLGKVHSVLPRIELAYVLLLLRECFAGFGRSQALHLLRDQLFHRHVCLVAGTWLLFEVEREDELRVVQDAVVDERILPDRSHQFTHFLLFCFFSSRFRLFCGFNPLQLFDQVGLERVLNLLPLVIFLALVGLRLLSGHIAIICPLVTRCLCR